MYFLNYIKENSLPIIDVYFLLVVKTTNRIAYSMPEIELIKVYALTPMRVYC